MQIELMRFRVKVGMAPLVDEWLAFLNENMPAVLETLEGEKMYVETIFSETLDGVEYLYWYSIQGEGGKNVHESRHWLDIKHLAYWKQCIDPEFDPVLITPRVSMIPERIRQRML